MTTTTAASLSYLGLGDFARRIAAPPSSAPLAAHHPRAAAPATRKVRGLAAVFYRQGDPGTEYVLDDGSRGRRVVERIRPKAFDKSLREHPDVVGLLSHDANTPLGRTIGSAPALKVWESSRGLEFELQLPDSPWGDCALEAIRRGEIHACSFGFIARRTTWIEDGTTTVRWLDECELLEISPCVWPAYTSTTVSLA
ncbi:MAG: HK97 family phage prohead protease [Planctomycetota bacterium]